MTSMKRRSMKEDLQPLFYTTEEGGDWKAWSKDVDSNSIHSAAFTPPSEKPFIRWDVYNGLHIFP